MVLSADDINLDGVIRLRQLSRLLDASEDGIRRRVRQGVFPIPPLAGIDNRLRWSGPVVRRWLDRNGMPEAGAVTPPDRPRRRKRGTDE